jgi:hypothetical protein
MCNARGELYMHWVFYSAASWIIITYYITTMKKSELVKSVIIYLVSIVLISFLAGIIDNNMKLIAITHDKIRYIDVLLKRVIVAPFLLLSLITKYNESCTCLKKVLSIALLLILFLVIEYIDVKMQLYKYIRWNLLFSMLLNSFYIFIALVINKYFYVIEQWGDQSK